MKTNSQMLTRLVCRSSLVLATAGFISVASATAQMNPGMPSQPTSPTRQTTPGSQPGTSPMDRPLTTNQDPNGPAAMMDKAFVREALEGGMAEVQLGQLALEKSSNPDVKQFAQKMVDDHTKLGSEMKQVAQQLGVKPPDKPSSKAKSTMTRLQALNGDTFDKAYIKDMVKDHQQDEKEFKQAGLNTSNPALKDVISQGAQMIGQHLQLIEQIAQKNNVVASK